MLQKIPVKVNTPEWLEARKDYIGCSDIPVLTGASRTYSAPIDIFYDKIGLKSPTFKMGELPFMGHIQEPVILDLWQYYEREKEKYIQNYLQGNKLRSFLRNDGFILVNPDVPFISDTPDGIIPVGEKDLYGNKLEKDCPIQAKNINHIKWHQYGGFIPAHQEQVHGEMMVFGVEYAEIASLVGGNELHIEQCNYDEGIVKAIYSICSKFWYDQVVPAKALAKRWKASNSKSDKEAIMMDIYALEPLPDDSEAYRSFLSERFQNRTNADKTIMASPTMNQLINYYQYYSDIEKGIKSKKNLIKNTLLRIHEHNGISLIQGENTRSSLNKKHVISGKELLPSFIKEQLNKLKP